VNERSALTRTLLRYGVALLITAVVTLILWLLRDVLTLANFALVYLLAILVSAIWLGTGPSLLVVVTTFFAFNFFLIRPYYNLTIEDPRELLDFLVFILTAIIAGQLAAYARQQSKRAQRSQVLEEADRLKTILLHAVSHDLRTPLTIIKTSADNLLNLYDRLSPAEQKEMIRTIEHETDQLNALVGNLLDLSRLKAGAMVMRRQWNSLAEIAGDVAARAWTLNQSQRVQLYFPDEMPLVCCDYGLILQALNNIVENVLRYEPPSSQVEVRGAYSGSEIRLSVINHGPDIPAAEKERIMEPFYHAADGRVGLGLAISYEIMQLHHGRLWVEDTAGGGATFVMLLPRQKLEPNVNPDCG
jgi:two-component system, OmpR family, sensor histidine kinase KdpD